MSTIDSARYDFEFGLVNNEKDGIYAAFVDPAHPGIMKAGTR